MKLTVPVEKRRKYTGVLTGVEGEVVQLLAEIDNAEQAIALPFSNIEKGNLIGEVQFNVQG